MDDFQQKLEKLASAVLALEKLNSQMANENVFLKEKLDSFEKRASIEQILIDARKKNGSPSRLVANSVDDFLNKRAMLEGQKIEEIEKVATMIRYLDDNDGIISLDENESRQSTDDLTSWLMSQA